MNSTNESTTYSLPDLSEAQQQELLKLARQTLTEYLTTHRRLPYQPADEAFMRQAGAFVTLRMGDDHDLRGCIGHIMADMPLSQVVQEMAIAAATSDPRFPPVTVEELNGLSLEISILSPLKPVVDLEEIKIGVHGLLISHHGRKGLLLPQVASEHGWTREEFLENLCLKAGLPRQTWTQQPTLHSFTALIIEEMS